MTNADKLLLAALEALCPGLADRFNRAQQKRYEAWQQRMKVK
jgi:hypothetical protein